MFSILPLGPLPPDRATHFDAACDAPPRVVAPAPRDPESWGEYVGPAPADGGDPMPPADRAVWSEGFDAGLSGAALACPADLAGRPRMLWRVGYLYGLDAYHAG